MIYIVSYDCEELVKILVTRCKKINAELEDRK